MKKFAEALLDGFKHITVISDPEQRGRLREEGVLIDQEGIYVFEFGEKKEYSLNIEPLPQDNLYRVALYKNKVILTEPLFMKGE